MAISRLRSVWAVLYDVYVRFTAHDAWAIASHVALSVLLALFPFLIVVTALAGFIGTPQAANEVVGLVFEGWPPTIAEPLAGEVMRVLTGRRLDLLTIGVLLVLWTASSGVEAMRVALVRAYGVPDMRSWWYTRLQSIGFVLLGAAAMILLSITVVLWGPIWDLATRWSPELRALFWMTNFVRYTLTGLFLGGALVLAHIWLPAGKTEPWATLPGIVVTLVLWLVGASAFGFWFSRFSNYASTYAGLGSLMAVIFFLYINSVVFIIGGELNAVLQTRRRTRHAREAAARLSQARTPQ